MDLSRTGCMCLSFCTCFSKQETEHTLPDTPWMCPVCHLWRAVVPTDGETHPSVLSWECLSRLCSSGWLVFIPNCKQQLYEVTQTVVYPEEILWSLWTDGFVTDKNGFWMITYGATKPGFCCPMQFYFSRNSVENVYSSPHMKTRIF